MRAILLATLILAAAGAAVAGPADFSSYWHDGKAELDGYQLTVSRYGQEREGYAVMIFVTEPFSESKRVKVDDQFKNPSDAFDVLKLNLVRDFQTGIYDYNTMVSVFVRSDNFDPVKVSFSSAEWCGHVYQELLLDREKVRSNYSSYFEDESGHATLDRPADGVLEDNLFILLRGLRGDYLEPGASTKVKLLPGVFYSRVAHSELAWNDATIRRRDAFETVEVPAGKFEVMVYDVSTGDGRTGTFHIERAYPHRVVQWELSPDVSGKLTGSDRLQYWNLHDNGHESYLVKLGLRSGSR